MDDEGKLPEWLILWGTFVLRLAYHFLGGLSLLLFFLQMPMIKWFFSPQLFEKINLVVICLLAPCIVISGGKGLQHLQKIFKNGREQ